MGMEMMGGRNWRDGYGRIGLVKDIYNIHGGYVVVIVDVVANFKRSQGEISRMEVCREYRRSISNRNSFNNKTRTVRGLSSIYNNRGQD